MKKIKAAATRYNKHAEFWLLFAWNIVAFVLSYKFGSSQIISAGFFLGLPAAYLSLRKPQMVKKAILFSIIFTLPLVIIGNYLAYKNDVWMMDSLTGIKAFDTYPVEDFGWGFMYIYYIITFYEYFFETEKVYKFPKIFGYFLKGSILSSVLFSLFLLFSSPQIKIPYLYLLIDCFFLLLPPVLIVLNNLKILNKLLKIQVFAFLPGLLYEYIALTNYNWAFPGTQFIGQVKLFAVIFPFEELLWLMLAVPATVAYYEFFADDRK